mgnify:CR=1 FL=1
MLIKPYMNTKARAEIQQEVNLQCLPETDKFDFFLSRPIEQHEAIEAHPASCSSIAL